MDDFARAATRLTTIILDRIDGERLLVLGDLDALDAGTVSDAADDRACQFVTPWLHLSREVASVGLDAEHADWTDRTADAAVVYACKAREELDMRLANAAAAVGDDGTVVLVGHNKLGITSLAKRARQSFRSVERIESARHCGAFALQGWTGEASRLSREAWWSQRRCELTGLTLFEAPGVFSRGHLDDGTARLIGALKHQRTGRMLDVCCGGGVIGLREAARTPELEVVLSDVHAGAIASARRSAAANGLAERVTVVAGDVYDGVTPRFQTIVCNPPFHSGSDQSLEVGLRVISEAGTILSNGGELILVANRFLAYAEPLSAAFERVDVLSEDGRFRVWRGRRPR